MSLEIFMNRTILLNNLLIAKITIIVYRKIAQHRILIYKKNKRKCIKNWERKTEDTEREADISELQRMLKLIKKQRRHTKILLEFYL